MGSPFGPAILTSHRSFAWDSKPGNQPELHSNL